MSVPLLKTIYKKVWRPGLFNLIPHGMDYGHAYDYEKLFCKDASDVSCLRTLLGRAPKRFLDLGGGSGRVSIALAKDGHYCTLLDRSVSMLNRARKEVQKLPQETQARIRILNGDLRNFRAGSFDCAASVNHAFEHLERNERLDALRKLHQESPLLVVDVHNPDHWKRSPGWSSNEWIYQRYSLWMRTRQTEMDVEWEHAVLAKGLRYRHLKTRLYFSDRREWEQLFESSDWSVEYCWGNWQKSPPSIREPKLIFVLRSKWSPQNEIPSERS